MGSRKDAKMLDIEVDIMTSIRNQLPSDGHRPFLPSGGNAKTQRQAILDRITHIRRWEKIQTEVGWLAIVFSQAFPTFSVTGTEEQFQTYLDALKLFRPQMIQPLSAIWPKYPRLLTMSGGKDALLILLTSIIIDADWKVTDLSDFRPTRDPATKPPDEVVKRNSGRRLNRNPRRKEIQYSPTPPPNDSNTDIPTNDHKEVVLPIWVWDDNSCALDAAALVPLLAYLECRDMTNQACKDPKLVQDFRMIVSACAGYKGRWSSWSADNLTELRNMIRADLKRLSDGKAVQVTNTSTIDQMAPMLAPVALTNMKVQTTFKCSRPGCIHSPKTDKGKFYKERERSGGIYFPGAWQKDCCTQDLIDTLVFPYSSNRLLTFPERGELFPRLGDEGYGVPPLQKENRGREIDGQGCGTHVSHVARVVAQPTEG